MEQDAKVLEAKTSFFSRCTPFALFIFFILGPCEPLIPLMSLGTETNEIFSSILVVSAFCGTTVITMLFCVMLFYYGISRFSFFMKLEDYMHAGPLGLTHFIVWISNPLSWCSRLNFCNPGLVWEIWLSHFLLPSHKFGFLSSFAIFGFCLDRSFDSEGSFLRL